MFFSLKKPFIVVNLSKTMILARFLLLLGR